ncbi:hypothetical protein [Laribacter hongkongensis]|uniref:hypothetical protein n=1 Tax=Laribacter hongkongensis TaxID=168471 RepID=UPI001EFCCB29|nr:hypothetical protein [Laribacter hongkongensis]MCG9040006.1 hypothetical protein [Laribacter hongkongensis]MCG9068855.1 hypothetical protein [Laribacter hongkongensis]
MSNLINQLATIETDSLPIQNDCANILADFKKNYSKLDTFKRKRSAHQNKNAIQKWWDNNELAQAQLDSIELQAEFSKTIGQLMLASIAQAKHLTEQQGELNSQQSEIKKQTEDISSQANEIICFQQKLQQQNFAIAELIKNNSDWKDWVSEKANQFILIANDINESNDQLRDECDRKKSELQNSFESKSKQVELKISDAINQTKAIQDKAKEDHANFLTRAKAQAASQLSSFKTEIAHDYVKLATQIEQTVADSRDELESVISNVSAQHKDTAKRLTDAISLQGQDITSLQDLVSSLRASLAEREADLQEKDIQFSELLSKVQEIENNQKTQQTAYTAELHRLRNRLQTLFFGFGISVASLCAMSFFAFQ